MYAKADEYSKKIGNLLDIAIDTLPQSLFRNAD